MSYYFTSESVSEGHPDKVCDAISDSILDAIFAQDPNARVACETFVTTGLVVVGGEITVKEGVQVDYHKVIRNTIKEIGYTKAEYKFDSESCGILNTIHRQSADIAMGV
ncbi:MAG: methionine adenosyltransferase, partial [Ignavibacteriales bacterium]|nr:methionine adenosyltransferase [Ignavibacteriales bacterium]